MDFSFSEDQETVGKVARQLFEHRATPEQLTELEAGGLRHDPALRAVLDGMRELAERHGEDNVRLVVWFAS